MLQVYMVGWSKSTLLRLSTFLDVSAVAILDVKSILIEYGVNVNVTGGVKTPHD